MHPDRQHLQIEVRRFDSRIRVLSDPGIDLRRPNRALLDQLRARKAEMERQHAELEATQREADRLLLGDLLDLYVGGSDGDRDFIRDLLRECRSFRWGFGWGLSQRIATAQDARDALAVLSMKDGDRDYRDAIVALDRICAAIRGAGLPLSGLLREAAGWSSDIARLPPARSTRALLLHYAERFA